MTERSEQILELMAQIILQYLSTHEDEVSSETIAVKEKENLKNFPSPVSLPSL